MSVEKQQRQKPSDIQILILKNILLLYIHKYEYTKYIYIYIYIYIKRNILLMSYNEVNTTEHDKINSIYLYNEVYTSRW